MRCFAAEGGMPLFEIGEIVLEAVTSVSLVSPSKSSAWPWLFWPHRHIIFDTFKTQTLVEESLWCHFPKCHLVQAASPPVTPKWFKWQRALNANIYQYVLFNVFWADKGEGSKSMMAAFHSSSWKHSSLIPYLWDPLLVHRTGPKGTPIPFKTGLTGDVRNCLPYRACACICLPVPCGDISAALTSLAMQCFSGHYKLFSRLNFLILTKAQSLNEALPCGA